MSTCALPGIWVPLCSHSEYDTGLGGYRTGITEQQLQGAPKYGNENDWNWEDPTRNRAVNDYYGVAM